LIILDFIGGNNEDIAVLIAKELKIGPESFYELFRYFSLFNFLIFFSIRLVF
jgi:hypothetical protein